MRHVFDLGTLRLDADAGVLTQGGAPLALGARGVAVLAALVTRAGEYLPKADIIEAAWPGLVVEEANLAVQISAIRRALACVPGGDGWIETLARRGYRFAGPVVAVADRTATAFALSDRTRTNLPQVLTSFVGRERRSCRDQAAAADDSFADNYWHRRHRQDASRIAGGGGSARRLPRRRLVR